jgi:hypothetical protein
LSWSRDQLFVDEFDFDQTKKKMIGPQVWLQVQLKVGFIVNWFYVFTSHFPSEFHSLKQQHGLTMFINNLGCWFDQITAQWSLIDRVIGVDIEFALSNPGQTEYNLSL